MELSPEEYGAYWSASIRVAGGVFVGFLGYQLVSSLLSHPALGATALALVLLAGILAASSFLVMLGIARVVRTAVDAEMRR